MKFDFNPISIKNQIVMQAIGNELFIYELSTDKIWCLNETCAFVWKICDGTNSVSDITLAISKEFKVKTDESFVLLTIDSLRKAGLLENGERIMQSTGNNFSRREAIKRAGLSKMSLPVISTIIAPSAVQAQSGCISPGSVECVFDNFTQSNCCDPNTRCWDYIVGSNFCIGCEEGHAVHACDFVGCCDGIIQANRCCTGPIIEREWFGTPGNYWCICP